MSNSSTWPCHWEFMEYLPVSAVTSDMQFQSCQANRDLEIRLETLEIKIRGSGFDNWITRASGLQNNHTLYQAVPPTVATNNIPAASPLLFHLREYIMVHFLPSSSLDTDVPSTAPKSELPCKLG